MNKHLKETLKYLLRSRWVIRKYINEVEHLYSLPAEDLRKRNERRFLEIFRMAYDKSPFYRRLYEEAGIRREDIKCLADIKKLPVVTKEMVKAHTEEIRIAPKWMLVKNHTSGTTGSPLQVYESWPALWREQAYGYCYRKRCGYLYGQPLVSLRGNLEKKDLFLKVHISNTLYLSSYNINPQNTELYYNLIIQHKPVAIEGYPSSLYSLALMLRDKGLQLHIPVAFTSSETLLDYQRKAIERQMGTQIYDLYGTTERTIRLSEAFNHNGYYEDPGYSINEYTEDGEITTSLINESFPLIRYKGNDVMEMMEATEEHPQLIVKQIEGRASARLVGKDGTEYSGALLTRVFKNFTSIDYAQFVQNKKGKVTLNYVPAKKFVPEDEKKLKKAVYELLGKSNFDITISAITPNEIVYTKRGKFNYIVALMGGVICRIQGRNEDYILCKDGTRVMRLDHIFKGVKHVKQAQMVQSEKGKLTVNIVPDKSFGEADLRMIEENIYARIGKGNIDCTVRTVTDNELRPSRSGKYKFLIGMETIKRGGVICKIQGRNEDYILCKDGTRVRRLGFVMKNGNHFKASQIVQEEAGNVILRLVPDDGFSPKDADVVVRAFQERVGKDNLDIKTELTDIDGLVYSPSGKFKYIVSKIK